MPSRRYRAVLWFDSSHRPTQVAWSVWNEDAKLYETTSDAATLPGIWRDDLTDLADFLDPVLFPNVPSE